MKFSWKKKLAIILSFVFVFSASIFIFKDEVFAQSACAIDAAATKFRPSGVQPPQYGAPNPYSFPPDGYSDNEQPFVYVDVKTVNCFNETIIVKLIDSSDDDYSEVQSNSDAVMASASVSIGVYEPGTLNTVDEDFTITFKAGENECNITVGWDCTVAVAIFQDASPDILLNTSAVNANLGQAEWYPPAPQTPTGVSTPGLSYECDGACVGANWQVIEILPYGGTNAIQAQTIQSTNNNLVDQYYPGFDDGYLAPILGNEVPNDLGGYIANIFQVLIIIAGILSFVVIVLGAIQYMTSGGGGGKAEGRGRIENAVFGIILALGAWVVLNTINPNLASNLGFNLPHAGTGRDTPQIPVNGKYCNGVYDAGQAWYDDSVIRSSLETGGVKVKGKNCTKVGQRSCTSVYNLGQNAVNKLIALKSSCGENCEVVVTGATECWLHGGNTGNGTTHQPSSNTVDISQKNKTLNEFIEGQTTGVVGSWSKLYSIGGPFGGEYHWEFLRRDKPASGSNHWHVVY